MDPVDIQLGEVRERFSGAAFTTSPDGARVLVVPGVSLPQGWNMGSVALRVAVPIGFPHVKPDCFYADANLRLADGGEPASSRVQAALGGSYRWFSWHLSAWDPVRGSLGQYIHFCERRLKEVR